mgnify:CR=1 FL=1
MSWTGIATTLNDSLFLFGSSDLNAFYFYSSAGADVVFTLYNKNHNQCKRKAKGTYKASIETFVRAYTRQMEKEYEAKGAEYEVDEDVFEYLECL